MPASIEHLPRIAPNRPADPCRLALGVCLNDPGGVLRGLVIEQCLPGAGPRQMPGSVQQGRPAHGRFSIRGLDGADRQLEATAIPLVGQANRRLGAVAVFWESDEG